MSRRRRGASCDPPPSRHDGAHLRRNLSPAGGRPLKAKPDVLEPLFAGTFRGSVGVLKFKRSKGKPTGFTLGTGRIRNMVFEKDGG